MASQSRSPLKDLISSSAPMSRLCDQSTAVARA
jgi:hypothetical protein